MTYAPALDSANHIPWAQAVGYAGGLRYLSSFPAKNLTQQEFSEARTAGKSLALVFEDQAQDALGGAVMGRLKAAKAAGQTRWLLWPADRPFPGRRLSVMPVAFATCPAFRLRT